MNNQKGVIFFGTPGIVNYFEGYLEINIDQLLFWWAQQKFKFYYPLLHYRAQPNLVSNLGFKLYMAWQFWLTTRYHARVYWRGGMLRMNGARTLFYFCPTTWNCLKNALKNSYIFWSIFITNHSAFSRISFYFSFSYTRQVTRSIERIWQRSYRNILQWRVGNSM